MNNMTQKAMLPSTELKRDLRLVGVLLLFFGLASWTGVWFRWSFLNGTLGEFTSLNFIRHAHSHLMFFSWAVPIPFWLMMKRLERDGLGSVLDPFRKGIYVVLILGLSTYPFFLIHGYGLVVIGSARIPVAAALSGINMIAWYVMAGLYYRARRQLTPPEDQNYLWWDGAWVMLLVSSLGAWGVSLVEFGGIESARLGKALTHFFLATFTEGWCLLTALGAMNTYFQRKNNNQAIHRYAFYGILFGALLMFPLGMSPALLTPPLLWCGRVGAALVATGMALWMIELWKSRSRRGIDFEISDMVWAILLGLKFLALTAAALLPSDWWVGQHGLRILYLHIMLLGIFSMAYWLMIPTQIQMNSHTRWSKGMVGSALLVLLSLIPLSSVWPMIWSGSWIYWSVLWIAFLPALVASGWGIVTVAQSRTVQHRNPIKGK
jgi:hypothetical protein